MTDLIVRRAVLDAGVWQEGHVVLNSERHSNVKLDMEQLLARKNTMRRRLVVHSLALAMHGQDYDALLPVPEGMLAIIKADDIPDQLPRIIGAGKADKREFSIHHPAARQLLKKAGRLAIADDVLTTGGTPLAVADTLRDLGCEAELDLYAIWRRDELRSDVGKVFAREVYLVEEPIPSWLAEDCICQKS